MERIDNALHTAPYLEHLMRSNSIADILTDRGLEPEDRSDDHPEALYQCMLPGHQGDEHTFFVQLEKNLFNCMGCHKSGNAIKLLMNLDGLSEEEALGFLARRSGIPEIPPAQTIHFLGRAAIEIESPLFAEKLTLARYARERALHQDFLRQHGVDEARSMSPPTIRFTYSDTCRREVSTRFLYHLGEDPLTDVVRLKKYSKPAPYGLWRLDRARDARYVILVDGEGETLTLWAYDLPALGLPGAWDEQWAPYLDGLEMVYLLVPPGMQGEELADQLVSTPVKDRLRIIRLGPEMPSLSLLHRCQPYRFLETMDSLRAAALSPAEEVSAAKKRAAEAAWPACERLAQSPDILAQLLESLGALGLAGEEKIAQVVYLAVVSRLLDRPVSVAVKGPSSSGKSFLVEKVLDHFPESAWFGRTAMSDRAIAYTDESLVHRFLVMFELAGAQSEMASYLIRSLLSENRIDYETVVDTPNGMASLVIHKDGPTGLIVTTTAASLHPENETRMLSMTVSDSSEQTGQVMDAIAERAQNPGRSRGQIDLSQWQAFQTWLEGAEHRVVIPYAVALSTKIPRLATRLRRDITLLLNLISAHAILYQCNRGRDEDGRIVAEIQDYGVVRELIYDIFAEGLEASVNPAVFETIMAAKELGASPPDETVTIEMLAQKLGLDRSTVRRRVLVAINKGLMKNLAKPKRPYEVVPTSLGLRETAKVLPYPEELAGAQAPEKGGDYLPPLPTERNTLLTESQKTQEDQ